MSTSTNINVIKSFMGSNGTLMEIKIKNNYTNHLYYCYVVQKIRYPLEEEIFFIFSLFFCEGTN